MTKLTKRLAFVVGGIFIPVFILLIFMAINRNNQPGIPKSVGDPLKLEVYRAGEGWGYNIFLGGKIIIKQDIIPAIQNSIPFHSEADARKVGQLVLEKLKKSEHPTIKIQEMDSLRVVYH